MSFVKALLRAIRAWRPPMLAWSRGDAIRSRCPKCRAPIRLTKVEAGKPAFRCPQCGEEATWKSGA